MNIRAIKSPKLSAPAPTLTSVLDDVLNTMEERSILAITSKIVSICEGSVVPNTANKNELVKKYSQRYIPPEQSAIGITLTITRNILIPSAGIDESNANGQFVLWPKDPYESARTIRSYLVDRFSLREVGVLITDSKTTPQLLGVTGTVIGYSGFSAYKNYIDTPDIFGRKLKVTKANQADGMAAAAVTVMGEGDEQTPLALITDIPFVTFSDAMPTKAERAEIHIPLEDDLYAPILRTAPWEQGENHQ